MQFIIILPFLPLSEGGDQQKRYLEESSDQSSKPNISEITSKTEIDLASNSIHNQSRFEGFDYKFKGQGRRRKGNGNKHSGRKKTRQLSRGRKIGADGKKLNKSKLRNQMKWKRGKKNPKQGLVRKGTKNGKQTVFSIEAS